MLNTTENDLPVGIFDSGLGGLTVLRELQRLLPNESFIYFGDTARVPYGGKGAETIKRYALEIATFLNSKKIKLLVIACNTATAVALKEIKEKFPLPVIGVIEPGINAAMQLSCLSIAVLGTKSTIHSKVYQNGLNKRGRFSKIIAKSCPLFVPLVEEGLVEGALPESVIHHYLSEIKGVESILLGCTHYPLLSHLIEGYFNKEVILISSARACAKSVQDLLIDEGLENHAQKQGKTAFFVTDTPGDFKNMGKIFLPSSIDNITKVSNLFGELTNC